MNKYQAEASNNTPFSTEELSRYSRHLSLAEIGVAGQQRLKNARVLCIGAGGLGSPLLLYLAAAGIGTLGIIDDDKVEISNLQRQVLYNTRDLHTPKAIAAKAKLQDLNPNIDIITHEQRLTKDNIQALLSQYDIIADGSDNFTTHYLINDTCAHLAKPNVYASILHFQGQCSVFTLADGPCYRCLYPIPPPSDNLPNCAQTGVLGVLPGLLGILQATEVLKLILGIGAPLTGRLLTVDALAMEFKEYLLNKNPACPICTRQQTIQTLSYPEMTNTDDDSMTVTELQQLKQQQTDFTLLDVREPQEYVICNLAGQLIPLGQLSQRLTELDPNKLIIVHCKAGTRSQQAALLLKQAGFKAVKHLAGGILAWAKEIDTSMPQY